MESGAETFLRVNPELAAIRLDQRAADGKPHADASGLGGKEGFEQALEILFLNARPIILYRHLGNAYVLYRVHGHGDGRQRHAG